MAKILVLEDDYNLGKSICEWLQAENHIVEIAATGEAALNLLDSSDYDLLVIDWGLPGISGLQVLQNYRGTGGLAPVIFLTARQEMPDKEKGFGAGADDYLTKPFDMRELNLRIKALLKRPKEKIEEILKFGHLCLDRENFRVTSNGEDIYLQRMEFFLLEFLMNNKETVFSAETILKKVWPSDTSRTPKNLRVLIKKLRDKIDIDGEESLIKTVPKRGYKLSL